MAAVSRMFAACAGTLSTIVFGILVAAPLLNIGFFPVLTGSMRPAIAPGDLIVTAQTDATGLKPDQVVVFTPPGETVPFAHRITEVSMSGAQPILRTKGDANSAPDSWRATLTQPQVPVVVAVVPGVGDALLWIQNPIPRALLIALCGLSLTGIAIRSILRAAPGRGSPSTVTAP